MTDPDWLSILNSAGIVTILGYMLHWFLSGKVVTTELIEGVIARVVHEVLDEQARRAMRADDRPPPF